MLIMFDTSPCSRNSGFQNFKAKLLQDIIEKMHYFKNYTCYCKDEDALLRSYKYSYGIFDINKEMQLKLFPRKGSLDEKSNQIFS